ncbi:MAG: peptidylprolyl isomerase [Cyanobacteria bacterium]|nr:peptidylprolyl isomerase [Cyanobacteriota bacterium]
MPACYANDPIVRLDTTKGPILIRVFQQMAPQTANNFLDLVSRGFYEGKIFHRIETWCIQGGDSNGSGNGVFVDPETGSTRFIRLEINRSLSHNSPGVVAMARSQNPNSASCQFYITKNAAKFLDGNYAIFGRVVNGMNSVYAMRRGDQITSASILGQGGGGGGDSDEESAPSEPVERPRRPMKDPTPYVPPSEEDIPDSGF